MENLILFLIKPRIKQVTKKWGISFCLTSFWIGSHYSIINNRVCIQIIPFVAIFINKDEITQGLLTSFFANVSLTALLFIVLIQ